MDMYLKNYIIILSVSLYVFMIAWNEFLFAFMFLDNYFTIPKDFIRNLNQLPRQYLNLKYYYCFLFLKDTLVGGLTAGSVKG